MANVKLSIMNKRNKASGAYFERMIDKACAAYEELGRAKIEKQQEPIHYIRPYGHNGQFIANYAKKSGVDYKGTLVGGWAICLEAKHTDTDRFERKRVAAHQMEYMRQHEKLGCRCFVLLSFKLEHFYRVPFSAWDNMKEIFGRQYITLNDAQKSFKRLPNIGTLLFLEGL